MPESKRALPDGASPGPRRASGRPPWAEQGWDEADSFGTWLRRQREMREVDLREIADRTKISIRYLKAMEQDRFDILPGPVFAKGFLREYAKFVGLSPDEVVNYYLSTHVEDDDAEQDAESARPPRRSWSSSLVLTSLALLLLAAIVLLFLFAERNRHEAARDVPPPIPAPVSPASSAAAASPPPEAKAAPETPLEVTLDFSQDCWVEAVVDGERKIAEQYVQGESLQISARRSVVFTTLGNAGGVAVQVNGKPYALAGRPGEVLHNVVIDLSTTGVPAVEEPPA